MGKLEYIFKKPRFFMTCVYGIMYLVLGNISGNALAFGMYIMIAAGHDKVTTNASSYERGCVIGLAIACLTLCAGLHIFSRRGGILISNVFAVAKIILLSIIIIFGWIHAAGRLKNPNFEEGIGGSSQVINGTMIDSAAKHNFDTATSFHTEQHQLGSYISSFFVIIYSYTGFEQPFYVLSEVRRPRHNIPRYTLLAMFVALILYTLVNVSYFCVVPKEAYTSSPSNTLDMAGTFFHYLFDAARPGYNEQVARRIFSGFVSFCIFGNVLVMTFTAARVKQEIAKEGILPFSLFFATGYTTPWARLRSGSKVAFNRNSVQVHGAGINFEDLSEKSPIAALSLHWFTSILLILATSMLKPDKAYSALVSLYSYVNVGVIGCLVSGGLLYLKIDSYVAKFKRRRAKRVEYKGSHITEIEVGSQSGRNWAEKADFKPWIDPLHCIVYFFALSFFLFGAFAKPAASSPWTSKITGYSWFIIPTIGLTSLCWGVLWWVGLKIVERNRRWTLDVRRVPYVERDQDGNYVQKAELVEHGRIYVVASMRKRGISNEIEIGGHAR
jgi:hypothetical protein